MREARIVGTDRRIICAGEAFSRTSIGMNRDRAERVPIDARRAARR